MTDRRLRDRKLPAGPFVRTINATPPDPAGDIDLTDDTGWIALTLAGGWVNYFDTEWQQARYRRINGIVYVQGLIKNGTVGASCGNLPAGYRPGTGPLIFTGHTNNADTCRIDVSVNGDIAIGALAQNPFVSLSSISFPADA